MRTAVEILSLIFGAIAFVFALGRAHDKTQHRLQRTEKDLDGVAKINRRVIGYLIRHADTKEEREEMARLIEGR